MTNTDQDRIITSATRTAEALDGAAIMLAQLRSYINGGSDWMTALNTVQYLEEFAAEARAGIVNQARAEGETWAEIGDALGTSRQNAQQRFGH